jgi:hypothetical protein
MGEDLYEATNLRQLSSRFHKSFVPTPQIASVGGTIIEFKSTLNYKRLETRVVMCKQEKNK